jgi:hypothetical protein
MFLTTPDIASRLPAGFNALEVDDLLLGLQADLENINLVFTAPVATTRQLGSDYEQSLFELGASDITSVQVKSIHSESATDLLATDYTLNQHLNFTNYYSSVWLDCAIRTHERLLVTGKFGLYIDFANTTSYPVKLLKSIITKFVVKQLEESEKGYKTIIESRTGDSMTKSESSKYRSYSPNITTDSEFAKDLSYFLP